jgi:hypothetical protein
MQFPATACRIITIFSVIIVSFAVITICVSSELVYNVLNKRRVRDSVSIFRYERGKAAQLGLIDESVVYHEVYKQSECANRSIRKMSPIGKIFS